MSRFFTRERFGRPQFLAAALLLIFLAQATWLLRSDLRTSDAPSDAEQVRLAAGWRQIQGGSIAGAPYPDAPGTLPPDVSRDADGFDSEHSPLLPLVTAAPLLALPQRFLDAGFSPYWRWLVHIPFLACGLFLGASLWYVARRLCGNAGGFLALTLYCFSPAMIQASALWRTDPDIFAAWGSFGAIFTAIAVAHTLYAPREVILWNWRRILLLGVALAITIGSEFSMIIAAPVALALMLYVAPIRRGAVVIIWSAACCATALLLYATYFFHAHAFSQGIRHASFWGATWRGFTIAGVYSEVGSQVLRGCPALALLLPIAIATYILWPRTRYFGNTAPGLVAFLFLGMGMAHPHLAGAGFLLASIPFFLIFVSGVVADLLETSHRPLVAACIGGLLGAYVLWNLVALFHVPSA
ncbi:MAG TPA: hypothetical protein VMF10_11235 [Candidatus Aquilonibacter sp.]|nr:hypothetical protein [Candidatus Aquilonibacter sp.]